MPYRGTNQKHNFAFVSVKNNIVLFLRSINKKKNELNEKSFK